MKNWKRQRRRRHKPFIILALFSIVNLLLPQHSDALEAARARTPANAGGRTSGVGQEVVPLRSGIVKFPVVEQARVKQTLRVVATAYSSSLNETDSDPFTTASGAKVRDGVVAANGFPFGTKLRIPDVYGDKILTVLDRMSARHGRSRIDIWMPTKEAATQWGAKYVRMEIL